MLISNLKFNLNLNCQHQISSDNLKLFLLTLDFAFFWFIKCCLITVCCCSLLDKKFGILHEKKICEFKLNRLKAEIFCRDVIIFMTFLQGRRDIYWNQSGLLWAYFFAWHTWEIILSSRYLLKHPVPYLWVQSSCNGKI